MSFGDTSSDWDNNGEVTSADATLQSALQTDSVEQIQVVVADTHDADSGGLGTDVLYGIENLQFGATSKIMQMDMIGTSALR